MPALSRVSGRESSARLLHRWQHGLGLGERSRPKVDAGGLGGDRDLLARRRVSARTLLLRWLDPDGQLHDTADADLLRSVADIPAPGSRRSAAATSRRCDQQLTADRVSAPLVVGHGRCHYQTPAWRRH